MKVKIQIPKKIFKKTIKQLKKFAGIENIGKVYCVGNWNKWGDSMEKAGCIRPKPEMEMKLKGKFYILEAEMEAGVNSFKPVVVSTKADKNGMTGAIWIPYPKLWRVKGYYLDKKSEHRNWLVPVT
jgi:hypothetical protein